MSYDQNITFNWITTVAPWSINHHINPTPNSCIGQYNIFRYV